MDEYSGEFEDKNMGTPDGANEAIEFPDIVAEIDVVSDEARELDALEEIKPLENFEADVDMVSEAVFQNDEQKFDELSLDELRMVRERLMDTDALNNAGLEQPYGAIPKETFESRTDSLTTDELMAIRDQVISGDQSWFTTNDTGDWSSEDAGGMKVKALRRRK